MPPSPLTLLAVYAHPDDEVFGTGGVFARAAAEGHHTVLICATLGEEGEIHDPENDTAEARGHLSATREAELRRSCAILGIQDLHLLGYRDSGMAGTPANKSSASFVRADFEEATGRVCRLLREVRPDVVVTFDRGGGYGHPDHIQIHKVTTAAVEAAADPARFPEHQLPAWRVPKFYYGATPRSRWEHFGEEIDKRGLDISLPLTADDFSKYMASDEDVTTNVDVRPYLHQKRQAMLIHDSQVGTGNIFVVLPEDLFAQMLGTESFTRIHSMVPAPEREDDLFAGLEVAAGS